MPYITQQRRRHIDDSASPPATVGELNYKLTHAIRGYLQTHGKSYTTINDIIGAIEGAKLEFYRRVAVPYEDTKIVENGDVW